MLLPPNSDCSVERRIRLGEELGSAMLVVIADAADDANLTHLVSSTTDIIFTSSDVTGDTASSPAYNEPPTSQAPPPAALGRSSSRKAERIVGGNPTHDVGREKGPLLKGDIERPGSVEQRQRLQIAEGDGEERTGRWSKGGLTGDLGCPPLTVVVGHDDGKRALEWLQTVGGGGVVARVAEREDVGRLWGDVVWASDPANWPKGARITVCFVCYSSPLLQRRRTGYETKLQSVIFAVSQRRIRPAVFDVGLLTTRARHETRGIYRAPTNGLAFLISRNAFSTHSHL